MALDPQAMAKRASEGRDWLAGKWRSFRSESSVFQLRAGLVVAYVAICVATVALVPPKKIAWTAETKQIPWGVSFKTALEINNLHGGDHNAVVEVRGKYTEFDNTVRTGTWRTKKIKMPEGKKVRVFPEDLRDAEKRSPANTLIVDELTVLDENEVILKTVPKSAK